MATAKPKAATAAKNVSKPSEAAQSAPAAPAGAQVPATVSDAATALAVPTDWRAKLAEQAKDAASKERPSISRISLRAGVISYAGTPVKGNTLPVVILAAGHRNAYYATQFDPNNLQNPACFAVSVTGVGMEAHENVPDENVPGETRECGTCPLNAWGSDPRGGRGKACKETRRLVLLPADSIDDAESVAKAELALVDIPVTSGKNYSNFVNGLAAAANVPPWAAVTEISTSPDPKSQFKVQFTPISVVEDGSVLEALFKRIEEAERLLLIPYDEVASTTEGKMQPAPAASKKY